MSSPRYRIVLVDDHPLFMEALGQRMSMTGELEAVGTASDSESGLRLALKHRPDLVVINVEIPGQGAFALAEDLAGRLPSARVMKLRPPE